MKYEIKNILSWIDLHFWELVFAVTSLILAYKYFRAIYKLNQYAQTKPLRSICNEGRDLADLIYFGLYRIKANTDFTQGLSIPKEAILDTLYVEKMEVIDNYDEDEMIADQDSLYVVRNAFLSGLEIVKARYDHQSVNQKKVREENTVITSILQVSDYGESGICWPIGTSRNRKTFYTAYGVTHLGGKDLESNVNLQMKYRNVIKKAQAHFAMNEKNFVPYKYKSAL